MKLEGKTSKLVSLIIQTKKKHKQFQYFFKKVESALDSIQTQTLTKKPNIGEKIGKFVILCLS